MRTLPTSRQEKLAALLDLASELFDGRLYKERTTSCWLVRPFSPNSRMLRKYPRCKVLTRDKTGAVKVVSRSARSYLYELYHGIKLTRGQRLTTCCSRDCCCINPEHQKIGSLNRMFATRRKLRLIRIRSSADRTYPWRRLDYPTMGERVRWLMANLELTRKDAVLATLHEYGFRNPGVTAYLNVADSLTKEHYEQLYELKILRYRPHRVGSRTVTMLQRRLIAHAWRKGATLKRLAKRFGMRRETIRYVLDHADLDFVVRMDETDRM